MHPINYLSVFGSVQPQRRNKNNYSVYDSSIITALRGHSTIITQITPTQTHHTTDNRLQTQDYIQYLGNKESESDVQTGIF